MKHTQSKPVVDLSISASKRVDSNRMQNLNDSAIIRLKEKAQKQQGQQRHDGPVDNGDNHLLTDLSDPTLAALFYPKSTSMGRKPTKESTFRVKQQQQERKAHLAALKEDLNSMPKLSEETPIHDLSDTAVLRLSEEAMRNLRGDLPDRHQFFATPVMTDQEPDNPSAHSPEGPQREAKRMEFTQELETNIEIIDEQHREYFETLSKLIDGCTNGMSENDMRDTFQFLDFFTARHFTTEEELMREYVYPGYREHHARHQEFCTELNNLKKRFQRQGITDALVLRLNYLLAEWFVKQVQEDDKKLSDYLHEKSNRDKSLTSRLADLVRSFTDYSK